MLVQQQEREGEEGGMHLTFIRRNEILVRMMWCRRKLIWRACDCSKGERRSCDWNTALQFEPLQVLGSPCWNPAQRRNAPESSAVEKIYAVAVIFILISHSRCYKDQYSRCFALGIMHKPRKHKHPKCRLPFPRSTRCSNVIFRGGGVKRHKPPLFSVAD